MRLLVAAIAATAATAAGSLPAAASPVSDQVPGGMVRLAGAGPQSPGSSPAKASYPSCARIEYRGNAGHIDVQEKNHRLQWGIVMTPPKYSIGRWDVDTYLSGKKTVSGIHRTFKAPYIPHGSLVAPSGKIFHVQAKVVGPYGTFVNVPNACRT